jgi:hypothetical protein
MTCHYIFLRVKPEIKAIETLISEAQLLPIGTKNYISSKFMELFPSMIWEEHISETEKYISGEVVNDKGKLEIAFTLEKVGVEIDILRINVYVASYASRIDDLAKIAESLNCIILDMQTMKFI